MSESWFDDEELPPRRRRNPMLAVVGVLVVLSLTGGIVRVAVGGGSAPHRRTGAGVTTTSTASTVPPSVPTESELDAVVADISAFVARARDLPFDHPVQVTLLADDAFQARVAEDAVEDEKELTETEGVLRALGLLDPGVSLKDALTSFLEQGVVGFYDPKTDELVVRGAAITPYVRTTLAHELTHALDDQHFQLDRPDVDDADDERGIAFSSLVEGNAVRIQEEYKRSLSKDDQSKVDEEEARLGQGLDLASIPRVIPELIGFPYIFGPQLLTALVEDGGERRVDAAFSAAPVTTEQVVDPAGWLEGKAAPAQVVHPTADGDMLDQGAIGFWGLYVLLEEELGQKDAAAAATGWGGDWYVAWTRGADVCVRTTFVMDTARDLDELTSALDDWAAAQDDAKVTEADGSVGFTACGSLS